MIRLYMAIWFTAILSLLLIANSCFNFIPVEDINKTLGYFIVNGVVQISLLLNKIRKSKKA